LVRYATERVTTVNTEAAGGNAALISLAGEGQSTLVLELLGYFQNPDSNSARARL